MKRCLIVKTSAIGDVISSFDVLSYLQRRFKNLKVDWVVERASAELLQAHPGLDRVIVCDTKRWRKGLLTKNVRDEMRRFRHELRQHAYDAVFDLQGNSKSALMTALARSKEKVGFDVRSVAELPNILATNRRFFISKSIPPRLRYLQLVHAYFQDDSFFEPIPLNFKLSQEEQKRVINETPTGKGPLLMVCFGSKWQNKRLPFSILIAFLKKISRAYSPIWLFPYSHHEERAQAEALHREFPDSSHTVGQMSLPFWQALMSKMDGIVTMDSAALHLCATTKTPSFSIFGPSKGAAYKPVGKEHVFVQGACPYGQSFQARCPKLRTCPKAPCMGNHDADILFSHFSNWWALYGTKVKVRAD